MRDNFIECTRCRKEKAWYNFKLPVKNIKQAVCFKCMKRGENLEHLLEEINIIKNLTRLYNMAEKQNMTALRTHLFDVIVSVKDKSMKIEEAKMICEAAQVIINSAKVEVDFIKAIGGKAKSEFLEIGNG